jgi:predicted alpha/beta-hydrolase family hydrolase
MNHPFMVSLSKALAESGIGTLRYNFPYMENGKKRPDPPAIAEKTVKEVVAKASSLFTDIPLFAGGKSFGGRMTSRYASQEGVSGLSGLIFYGFPLHAAGQPSTDRADHLKQIKLPMLFLQGTRDALADLSLIKKVTASLKDTTLTVFEGGDHSFKAGKKVLIPELAEATKSWVKGVLK